MTRHVLINGDCRNTLLSEGADLIYLDPPFFTQRDFTMGDKIAYSDKWESKLSYAQFLRAVLKRVVTWLQPHGVLVLHVDPMVSDVARALMRPFDTQLTNEIVWHYRRWPAPSKCFQRMHDTLLVYRRPSENLRWTQLYQPLAASTMKSWGDRKQLAIKTDGVCKKRKKSSSTTDESPGCAMADVWSDIGVIAPMSKERTGYPTQKPQALLERLITAFTLEQDLVVDPMCGSGTTLAAAKKLGRRSIGIDQSLVAIEVAEQRLNLKRAA